MNPILRNILALVAGIVAGSGINMGIVQLGGAVAVLPEGVDPTSVESIKANIHLFDWTNFIFPFLAHAIGTLAGAFLAAIIAASRKLTFALVVGAFFLAGGVANSFMIPAPAWFIAVDLVFAYLPMGYLGVLIGKRFKKK